MKTDETSVGRGAHERNHWWAEAAFFALLILLTLPARIPTLGFSLWLDEAWVANSVLMPSLSDTLNYPNWVQSSPPLYLALERLAAAMGGPTEVSLRMPSLIASLAALATTAWVLRKHFTTAAATLATAMLAANYTQLKYGQQLKQYAIDMLVAAFLIWLIAQALENGTAWLWGLCIAASFAPFLSFPSVFYLPSIVVLMALRSARAGWRGRFVALMTGAVLPASLLAVNYFVFIRPNRTPALLRNWRRMFVDLSSPVQSIVGAVQTMADLMVPDTLPGGGPVGMAMVVVLAAGILAVVWGAIYGKPVAQFVTLTAVAPLIVGFGAACFRLYPMLWSTRMLIWALPACALLVAFVLDGILERFAQAKWLVPTCAALALTVVIASQIVLLRNPRPGERNREAVATLQERMSPGDCLYLQGGVSEQFFFYAAQNKWMPPCVYLGNTGWPCCGRNLESRVFNSHVREMNAEVVQVSRMAQDHRLWLLLPTGAEGHWSRMVTKQLRQAPDALREIGCADVKEMLFGQTKLVTCSLNSTADDRQIVSTQ